MPGVIAGNPPGIFTPGSGPNGPGPVDARMPETSVGFKSSVPYGWTQGYANGNGVNGFSGPSADSLRAPINWYVRAAGNNNNGGSSASLTPDRSGADGVGNGTTTFTSATAAFTQADVGKGICINTGASARRCRIVTVVNSTTIVVDVTAASVASGLSWAIGGAWGDPRAIWGDTAITGNNNSPVRSGDNAYIGAGTYRIASTIGNAWVTATEFNGYVNVIGDVDGFYTGDAGMVMFNGATLSDKATNGGTPLNLNGKSNITIQNIFFGAPSTNLINGFSGYNISFINCAFQVLGNALGRILVLVPPASNANYLIDRCHFFTIYTAATGNAIQPVYGANAYNDYDINITVKNCRFLGYGGSFIQNSQNAGNGVAGGFRIFNCSFYGPSPISGAGTSIKIPCVVVNSLFLFSSTTAISSGNNQWFQDYNIFMGQTVQSGTAVAGSNGHSISSTYSPYFHWGQEVIWGGILRPFGEPMANSSALGFGGMNAPSTDMIGRPRPAGGGSPLTAAGSLERGNTAVQAASPVPPSGTNVWQLVGPGYQDFLLPVSAVASGFSIYVQRDSNYLATLGNPAIVLNPDFKLDGVTQQTVVDSGAANAWNQISFASFTPTNTGWVKIRLVSYDLSGTSLVSFAVAAPTP